MENKTEKDYSTFNHRFSKIFWAIFVLGIIVIVSIFILINNGAIGYLPPLEDLQNPKNNCATEIYSDDSQLIGQYYRNENRVSISYAEISPYVTQSLIATEDVRFLDHAGIDEKSLLRVILKMGRAGGGSTITQQLAKQLYSPHARYFPPFGDDSYSRSKA